MGLELIKTDFLIIGAGIIGLAIGKTLRDLYPQRDICIVEKEPSLGVHSSGRNSGVLHAGFYYTPDSLKAKFTRLGNYELTRFCEERGLKINKCGKVVIARNEKELEILKELKRRGEANGVELYLITEKELREIEPGAKTYRYAIWSPSTATVEPLEILKTLEKELKEKEIRIFYSTPYEKVLKNEKKVMAGRNVFIVERIINCAGLYADRIAKDFGFSKDYEIVPFKGLYLEYSGNDNFIKTNLYPVPDITFPFLGVHFTVTVNGKIKIGPTAIPVFSRENYKGLKGLKLKEILRAFKWNWKLAVNNAEFRRLAVEEIKKYNKKFLIKQAGLLVKTIPDARWFSWSKPGIRAQLIDIRNLRLVQDFLVEGDGYSTHILNAVSPAFTASLPFARYVVENYIK